MLIFWRGLSTEQNLRFKIDWASLTVGSKFIVFALFYLVFEGNFPNTSPRGAYIWRSDLMEDFLCYRFGGLYLEGLIHGGAYTWRGLFSEFCLRLFPSCSSLCFKEIWTEWFFYFHEDKAHFNKKGLTLCLVLKATVFELRDGPFSINYNMLFSGFLRRYIHTSNLGLRLECCLLSATFFKVWLTFWIAY